MDLRHVVGLLFVLFTGSICAQVPVISWTVTPKDTVCSGATIHVVEAASNGPINGSSFVVNAPPNSGGYGVTGTVGGSGTNAWFTLYGTGNYTFCASATNASGTGSGCYTIVVLPTSAWLGISVSPQNPACLGHPVSFTATTNYSGTATYQWAVNGANVGTNSPYFSSSTLSNNSVISVSMHANTPCMTDPDPATYTVHTTNPQTPTVSVSPDSAVACLGGQVTLSASAAYGGANPAYQWFLNGMPVGNGTSQYTLNNASASDQVWVALTSNATCITDSTVNSDTAKMYIIVPPSVTITASAYIVCPGQPDTLMASGQAAAAFLWDPAFGLNTTNGNVVTATIQATGDHMYHVTASLNGCVSEDSVLVQVTNTLVVTAGIKQTVCQGQNVALLATGGNAWSWSPSAGLSCALCQAPTASPTATTIYTVVATHWGCADTTMDTVNVIPAAVAAFTPSVVTAGIPQVWFFLNNSQNATSCYWEFGDQTSSPLVSPSHVYDREGTYPVVLIAYAANGCNDTNRTTLQVADTVGVVVPNVFTPNGDNINDVFEIDIHGCVTYNIVVYDRWGLKMFESENKNWWDGATTAGVPCNSGTYYYVFTGISLDKRTLQSKGYVQLVR